MTETQEISFMDELRELTNRIRNKPKNKIVILQGPTSSGKTTVSNWLNKQHSFLEFHPYGFRKRQLEKHYRCPNLDSPEGKAFIPEGMTLTMQELMMEEYYLYKKVDPLYTARLLQYELEYLLDGYNEFTPHERGDVCVVSIRNIAEVKELIELIKLKTDFHDPYFIRLYRPGYEGTGTDENMNKIWSIYQHNFPSDWYEVHNDSTEEDLFSMISDIIFQA